MKNKLKTYLLLVLVIVVWGAIGFKIWNGLNDNVAEQIAQNPVEVFKPNNPMEADVYTIQEVSRDPFLGTIKSKASTSLKSLKKQPIEWMPIVYKGLIKNSKTKEQVYVVQINNTEYLSKKGNVTEGVMLIRGNSEAITLSYKGEQKTITYQE